MHDTLAIFAQEPAVAESIGLAESRLVVGAGPGLDRVAGVTVLGNPADSVMVEGIPAEALSPVGAGSHPVAVLLLSRRVDIAHEEAHRAAKRRDLASLVHADGEEIERVIIS